LPISPGVGATTATPDVAGAAGAPGIASVEVLAVVAGDPGREGGRAAQMAAIACADIDDRVQEVSRLGLHIHCPIVVPGVVRTFAACNAAEDFAVYHWVHRLTVSGDLATSDSPEVIHLSAGAGGFRMSEVIRAHLQAVGFAVAHVAGEVGVGVSGAFGGFGEREADAVSIDAAPTDGALIAGHVHAEEAVGGVVGSESSRAHGESDGCNDAECVLD